MKRKALPREELEGIIQVLNEFIEARMHLDKKVLQEELEKAEEVVKRTNDPVHHGRFLGLQNLIRRFDQILEIRKQNALNGPYKEAGRKFYKSEKTLWST